MTHDFSGVRALVTGADGFIGSHLSESLVTAGAHVRALVYYNSWNEIGWLSAVPREIRDEIEIFPGDIRDAERVKEAIRGCAQVFHLASLIAIPYSYNAPRSYVETNVGGALNVALACYASDTLERLVHVSTSEVYGTARQIPISEDHPVVGQSPYSASKIGADKIIESFNLSFGLPVVTARPFNTFGPRQTARAVIPTIASQLLTKCTELRLGALGPTRDFVYVTDTAAAMMALAKTDSANGQLVNIGSGCEWSIEQTAHLLMKITGHECPIHSVDERLRPGASEVQRLVADTSRLHSLTGWTPEVEFSEGLGRSVIWVGENLDRFNPETYAR